MTTHQYTTLQQSSTPQKEHQQQQVTECQSPASPEDSTESHSTKGSPPPQQQQQHQHSAGTVFVGGISYKVDEEQLKECFEKYGNILEVRIIRDKFNFNQSKGYGFVTFEDPQCAENVKSEGYIELMGKTMNVGEAYRGGTRGKLSSPTRSPSIYNSSSTNNVNNNGTVSGRYPAYTPQSATYFNVPYPYAYATASYDGGAATTNYNAPPPYFVMSSPPHHHMYHTYHDGNTAMYYPHQQHHYYHTTPYHNIYQYASNDEDHNLSTRHVAHQHQQDA